MRFWGEIWPSKAPRGPDVAVHGVVRWRCVDLQAQIQARFDVMLSARQVERILKRLQFTRLAELAQTLLDLPRHEKLLAVVTDYGLEDRAIVAMAVEMVQARCPELNPYFVIDRFHSQQCFADAFNVFRITTHQSFEHDR